MPPMPKLATAKPYGKTSIRVMWKTGTRAGKSEIIDLSPLINCFKFYKALRKNDRLFRTLSLIDDGEAIAWGDGKIFFNNLGHNESTWTDKRFLDSTEAAIRWIRNEVAGDATPNPDVSKAWQEKSVQDGAGK